VSLLRSGLFGEVELRACQDRGAACPFRVPAGATDRADGPRLQCLAIDWPAAAADLLRAATTHDDDMQTLRDLVADEGPAVAWLSSHQVIDLVADSVVRRNICLLMVERKGGTAVVPIAAAAAPAGFTPSMLQASVGESLPALPALEIPEFADELNQAMQAATLEQAAQAGVPFCAVCEKAKREREAAAAAGRQ